MTLPDHKHTPLLYHRNSDIKALLRIIGILLMAEGGLMALCIVPAVHFADGTIKQLAACSAFTIVAGAVPYRLFRCYHRIDDRRMSYLLVVSLWVVLTVFAAVPFLATGSTAGFATAFFESMSGLTATGATIFDNVAALPASMLLWRSMMQWFGGFGIVLLVLALSPRMGINRYSLYTAEASGADNSGAVAVATAVTVRRTLSVYLALTAVFILLLRLSGMEMWDAVNLTFTNISSGGFSVNADSIATVTPLQQYILAAAMFLSGVNFSLLYLFFTFRWGSIGHKFDQLRFYITLWLLSIAFAIYALHYHSGLIWQDAIRLGTVQTISALTTTGSVVADTTHWWMPLTFVLLMLSLCGGMAGSTSGGLKIMRVLILLRNVRRIFHDRLHPNAVNPLRLNGEPVSGHLRSNVMVIFMIYVLTLLLGMIALMFFGVSSTEAIGASVGCLTGYGPGLGASGGFGSYAAFTPAALWFCSFLMLLGRLECMTVLILFLPRFWRK